LVLHFVVVGRLTEQDLDEDNFSESVTVQAVKKKKETDLKTD